jgi:3-deoxy-D-manno-octulosonate 8-phosphate phosphatase (KDO 8-P phosphatase)
MHYGDKDFVWFQQSATNTSLINRLQNTKLLVCDVDGALTNGVIYITEQEEEGRHFSILDGYGIIKAMQSGIIVSLMSGKEHNSLHVRGTQLSIPDQLRFGKRQMDKAHAIKQLQEEYSINDNQVVMFGDDIIDWKVKDQIPSLLFATVADSPFYIQAGSDLIVPRRGGDHALRLFVDLLLFAQGQHPVQELIKQCIESKKTSLYEQSL